MIRLTTLGSRLADILLPPLCLHCGDALPTARPGVCRPCLEDLTPLPPDGCRRCRLPRPGEPATCGRCRGWPASLSAVAGTRYDGVARSVVGGIKYGGWRHLGESCATVMQTALDDAPAPDVLVPVPLHPVRLRERGFNQSRVIAEALGRRMGVAVEDALSRGRATESQVGLDRAARRANVRGAFRLRAGTTSRSASIVGLVDDVATSGATLAAAAEPLLGSGVGAVVGVTFALAFEGVSR